MYLLKYLQKERQEYVLVEGNSSGGDETGKCYATWRENGDVSVS